MKKYLTIFGLAGTLAAFLSGASVGDGFVAPLARSALQGGPAQHAVMLAVASAGARRVAVGERGVVLYSDDGGSRWQQARVPVSVTLTALSFPTPQIGFAIGHAGVVLRSDDAGVNWTRVLDGRAAAALAQKAAERSGDSRQLQQAQLLVSDGADKPLLALHFSDAEHGFVIGAYGLIFGTEDGGRSWSSWLSRVDNPRGLHLNAVAVDGERILIAGEQGLLLRSLDGGQRFERIASPYKGSWFAAARQGPRLVIAGLKGNAWWSDDEGARWTAAEVPLPVSLSSVVVASDGRIWFSNQAGAIFASDDGAATLASVAMPRGPTPTAVALGAQGDLLLPTFAGITRVPSVRLPAPPQASSSSSAAAAPNSR